jgi:hypothetical protein
MFRTTHRLSSGALNCICSLQFIRPHVEPSINFGIINSITKLHLVGISTEESTMHGSMSIKSLIVISISCGDLQIYFPVNNY